jgi:hypothetical protein
MASPNQLKDNICETACNLIRELTEQNVTLPFVTWVIALQLRTELEALYGPGCVGVLPERKS